VRYGWTISTALHLAVLGWAAVRFGSTPLPPSPPPNLMPIDVVSDTDVSQITAGIKSAPKAEKPKPLVEKIAEPKPNDNPTKKIVEKPEVVAAADEPPKPEPPKPEAKPTPAPPVPQPRPEPKADPIAEAIKQEQAKKPEPKQQPKKQETKQHQKFDASQIQQRLALLDKRDPQRRASTGDTLSQTPSLGAPTGNAASLSQSEIDALRARIQQCWSPPVGLADARDLAVVVRIQFNRDGSLTRDPTISNHGSHPMFQIAAESALRAVRRCAPYSFMPPAKYDIWKDVEVTFDPRDMFRG
jgi:colicin import membrane protein